MSSALAPLRAAPRLPRTVKLLGAVSLLNDFASEMIYPLLPAFMTGVLGAGPQALGALDGAAEFAASVVKFGAGRRPGLGRRLAAACTFGEGWWPFGWFALARHQGGGWAGSGGDCVRVCS